MPKVGTATIEIKPVLNAEALAAITDLIEQAVAEGVARGLADRDAYKATLQRAAVSR